jgi:NADH:ubiquinone oxidoreductase subunit F (NADH-binding)
VHPLPGGCGWIERILVKVVAGRASMEELDLLTEIASDMVGNTICAFGDGAAQPVLSFLRNSAVISRTTSSTAGAGRRARSSA